MATEYLTNDIELTSVADAIRAKSGQTGQLIYPDGFASAVAGIKKAPTTPYMEAEYVAVEAGGITSRYIKRAKIYNHTAFYAYEFAFQYNLNSLDFRDASNNITAIERNAFYSANLAGIVLPDTITSLQEACFAQTMIVTLELPALITEIPNYAFRGIYAAYSSETDEEIPINIILPPNLTKIGESAFESAMIQQISIPNTVTEIGKSAFQYCLGLTSFAIPPLLQKIPQNMLLGCENVTAITVPAAVTEIGEGAFTGTGITSITIPATVKTLGTNMLQGCVNLATIDIQANVTEIPEEFASECPLTSLTLPNTLQTIGRSAFIKVNGLQITELTIPASVTSIGDYAFVGSNASQMTLTVLPTTPPTLGRNVFNLAAGSVIKVPAASVAAYKAADGWKDYANYIVAM